MTRTHNASQDADIDIGRLFGALWRDRLRILLGTIVVTGLVFLVVSGMTPKYRSDARILIESSESVFTRPEGDRRENADSSLLDQQGVTSQVEILRSTDLLMNVATELNLEQNEEFNPDGSMSAFKSGLVALGLIEDMSQISAEKKILDAIRERLEVYPIPQSRVIVVEFRSADQDLAARFPNALAEAYLQLESRAQLETTGRAASYLADEIADLQDSVREAEAAVADFRASSDLLVGTGTSVLATQQLGETSSELSRVRAERSGAEARARSIRTALDSGASIDSLSDIVQSELIGRLREREISLQSELADLSATLLPGHPSVQGLQSQLQDLSRRIRSEARRVLEGLQNEAEIARAREQELVAELNRLKAASVNANESEIELRALEREAASQRALLETYLVRFREAQSRDEGEYAPAKARLISRAVVPSEPYFPKMIPMLGAAIFVSMLLMMIATLMRELFSGRAFVPAPAPVDVVITRDETPFEETEIPVVAAPNSLPGQTTEQSTPADTEPQHRPATGEDFSVRALLARLIETGADRAVIVSPEGAAGAVASVALSRALAAEGLRTVLVDLTGSGAASLRMLADTDRPGITDLLASSASYSEVIYPDFATGAHVIPTGTADPEIAMRAADRLPIILGALVSAYDIVVVECGPTTAEGLKRLVGDDGLVVVSVVDPASEKIVETAENLVAGGYEDITLVTADPDDELPHAPYAGQAYAR